MKRFISYAFLCCLVIGLPACEVIGGIFKAGMIWGVLLVVLVMAGITALVMRSQK